MFVAFLAVPAALHSSLLDLFDVSKSAAFGADARVVSALVGKSDHVHVEVELVDVVPTSDFSVDVFGYIVLTHVFLDIQYHVSRIDEKGDDLQVEVCTKSKKISVNSPSWRIAIDVEVDLLFGHAVESGLLDVFEQLGAVDLLHSFAETFCAIAVLEF